MKTAWFTHCSKLLTIHNLKYLTWIIETNSIPGKNSGNYGMIHLVEIYADPSPLLNVAVYWQSSNTKSCTKKLPQILANNVDKGGRGLISDFMWGTVAWNGLVIWDDSNRRMLSPEVICDNGIWRNCIFKKCAI